MIFINIYIYMFESLNKDYYYLGEDFYFTEAEKKFILTGMFTLSTYGKLLNDVDKRAKKHAKHRAKKKREIGII